VHNQLQKTNDLFFFQRVNYTLLKSETAQSVQCQSYKLDDPGSESWLGFGAQPTSLINRYWELVLNLPGYDPDVSPLFTAEVIMGGLILLPHSMSSLCVHKQL